MATLSKDQSTFRTMRHGELTRLGDVVRKVYAWPAAPAGDTARARSLRRHGAPKAVATRRAERRSSSPRIRYSLQVQDPVWNLTSIRDIPRELASSSAADTQARGRGAATAEDVEPQC